MVCLIRVQYTSTSGIVLAGHVVVVATMEGAHSHRVTPASRANNFGGARMDAPATLFVTPRDPSGIRDH